MRWDPVQYTRYREERGRPFYELLARVGARAPRQVVDLGCGPGELTTSLGERWPDAKVLGIDSSPEMIERARAHAKPGLSFLLGDLREWRPTADTDVVISNATLQWIPEHRALLTQWADALPPQAWLAWQVPGNFGQPSHVAMRELAGTPRWLDKLRGVLRGEDSVDTAQQYFELLSRRGFEVDAWETTYVHALEGDDPVLQWVRGTGLRPVLSALESNDAAEFEREYAELLRHAYPARSGVTPFAFRRVFCVGYKR